MPQDTKLDKPRKPQQPLHVSLHKKKVEKVELSRNLKRETVEVEISR